MHQNVDGFMIPMAKISCVQAEWPSVDSVEVITTPTVMMVTLILVSNAVRQYQVWVKIPYFKLVLHNMAQ
jgi:hypothetical protein